MDNNVRIEMADKGFKVCHNYCEKGPNAGYGDNMKYRNKEYLFGENQLTSAVAKFKELISESRGDDKETAFEDKVENYQEE